MSDELPQCEHGRMVRLSAQRVRLDRRTGVWHGIVHRDDGRVCRADLTCVALKPYPKDEQQREYRKLLDRYRAERECS